MTIVEKIFCSLKNVLEWVTGPEVPEAEKEYGFAVVVSEEGETLLRARAGCHRFENFSGWLHFYTASCRVRNATFVLHINNARSLAAGAPTYKGRYANTIEWLDGEVLEGNLRFCEAWHAGTFGGNDLSMVPYGDFEGGVFRGARLLDCRSFRGTVASGEVCCRRWLDGVFAGDKLRCAWEKGVFQAGEFRGEWQCGSFEGGTFLGAWKDGVFRNGLFAGRWYGGTFEGGVWQGDMRNGDGVMPPSGATPVAQG